MSKRASLRAPSGILFVVLVLIVLAPLLRAADSPTADPLEAAERRYLGALEKAKIDYDVKVRSAKEQYVRQLKAEMTVRTRKGDLEGALKVREKIRTVEEGVKPTDVAPRMIADGGPETRTPPNTVARDPVRDDAGAPPQTRTLGVTLVGVQQEEVVTLVSSPKPYRLKGEYNVPAGKRLVIEAGARIECDKDSELSVNGSLTIDGTNAAPVRFEGRQHGYGYWKGISLREAKEAKLVHTWVTDAVTGVYVRKCQPYLQSCVLAGNGTGMKAGEYGSGSKVTIDDCVLSLNEKDGLELSGSSATIESTTITRNGGWGIRGEYYASPKIGKSLITKNRGGGLWCKLYDCNAEARNSAIFGNGSIEIKNESAKDWDFSGNYLGRDVARAVKAKGETVNLPMIHDGSDTQNFGKVRISGALPDVPPTCGSSIQKIGNQSVQ